MSATITSLPPDVMKSIFALLPQRPRLQLVSRVCKRWRTLVLQTGFSLANWANWEFAAQLLCIVSAEISEHCPPSVARSLRNVTLLDLSAEALACLSQHATSLQSIVCTRYVGAEIVTLLHPVAPTLTSLDVLLSEDAYAILPALELPRLQRLTLQLSLNLKASPALPCDFLSAHTSVTDLHLHFNSWGSGLDEVDCLWRAVAHLLRPLPNLVHVTLAPGVCREETFFELVSKFPSTACIHLWCYTHTVAWQSYARQFPSNVTGLTLSNCHDSDLRLLLLRFPNLTDVALELPSLAVCTSLANMPHRTALTSLDNQGFEPEILCLLRHFPQLRVVRGLRLSQPVDVEQVAQWNFTALHTLTVSLDGAASANDLCALLPALPALRRLSITVLNADSFVQSDTDALLEAVVPRLRALSLHKVTSFYEQCTTDVAWELLQQRVRSYPWLNAE